MRKTLLLALLLSTSTAAELSIEILEFKRPSVFQAVLFCLSLLGFCVLLYLFEKHRRNKDKQEQERSDALIFSLQAEKLGLNTEERALLKKLARRYKNPNVNLLLESIDIYEECLHEELVQFEGKEESSLVAEEEKFMALRKKMGYNFLDNEHPLPSTRNLSIGQPVSLFSGATKAILLQEAKVVDNREFSLKIQYDVDKNPSFALNNGDKIRLIFARQADGMYEAEVSVLSFTGEKTFRLGHTLSLKRRQLRRDIRLNMNAPLKFRLVKSSDKNKEERLSDKVLEGRIADVSGGGMSFVNDMELQPGDILSLNFNLSEGAPLSGVQAKVLRVSQVSRKEDLLSHFHLQFIEISPSHKDRIVKFIFEKMRLRKQLKL